MQTPLGVAILLQKHIGQCKVDMNKDNELYQIVWTQVYEAWPVEPEQEEEVLDLTLAREVLAKVMAK